jgi:hypothetical protein
MALHDEPQKSPPELPVAGTSPPSYPDISVGAGQESRAHDMMVEALQHNVDELKQVNKNLRIDIEGQAMNLTHLRCGMEYWNTGMVE